MRSKGSHQPFFIKRKLDQRNHATQSWIVNPLMKMNAEDRIRTCVSTKLIGVSKSLPFGSLHQKDASPKPIPFGHSGTSA